MLKEELKKFLKDHECFAPIKKSQEDYILFAIDEFFNRYQPERSKREDLDDKRIHNSDGTLHNAACPVCGLGRWSSLHQECGALNSNES